MYVTDPLLTYVDETVVQFANWSFYRLLDGNQSFRHRYEISGWISDVNIDSPQKFRSPKKSHEVKIMIGCILKNGLLSISNLPTFNMQARGAVLLFVIFRATV